MQLIKTMQLLYIQLCVYVYVCVYAIIKFVSYFQEHVIGTTILQNTQSMLQNVKFCLKQRTEK